jgi:isoamyl acetate esterase
MRYLKDLANLFYCQDLMIKKLTPAVLPVFLLLLLGLTSFVQPAPTKRIVFLGDSITQAGAGPGGYISLMRQSLAGAGLDADFELIGAGISGNKVPDLQKRLDQDVLAKNPDLVFIYIGINDVWHWTHPNTKTKGGTTKANFEAGLKDVIARIRKQGAKVVVCTPTVIGEKGDGTNPNDKMLDEYAELSRKVAREQGLQVCDLRKAFVTYLKDQNKDNVSKGIFTTDEVHLNAAGNAFLALQMLPFLASI